MPSDKEIKSNNSIFKAPKVELLDEKQWSYLQRRYQITPRELQVVKLVCRGLNDKEIAKNLKIERGTVKTHLRNVYRRVRVKRKVTLLLRFLEDVTGFYIPSRPTLPAVPIVDFKKPRKKTAAPTETPKKGK